MSEQQTLEVMQQTVIRQAAELTRAHAEIEGFQERIRKLLEQNSEDREEISKLKPAAEAYAAILGALKRGFQDGSVPVPAIIANRKAVPTVIVGEPEFAVLSGMRILPFQVTYSVGSSSYGANFVLAPVLEEGRINSELFPKYKPAEWDAKKPPTRRKKQKQGATS